MILKRIIAAAAVPLAAGALTAAGGAGVPAKAGTGPDYRAVCAPVPQGHVRCMALLRTNVPPSLRTPPRLPAGAARRQAGPGPFQYEPADLQAAYNLSGSIGHGDGETVAVVDAYNNPNAASDLAAYRSQFGLPPANLRVVNQDGGSSPLPPDAGSTGWAGEESLDLDMVSAICPRCSIILVEADTNSLDDLGTGVDTAVRLGAGYVSNSYGASEFDGENTYDRFYDHPGTAVTASAGDWGYEVEYPAASQYVTAVGGTTLYQDPETPRGWTESVWGTSAGFYGTGSGCSGYGAKPSWQTDAGCANRTVGDVAADADPDTGVYVYDTYDAGGWAIYGGTSASSPIIASIYALAGEPRPGDYPASYPYQHTASLNDVTTGANGTCSPAYLCNGEVGYDGPTGLGTPNGAGAFRPSGTDTVTVTNPGNQSSWSGDRVSLQIHASSSDGLPLTYSAAGLPDGLSINSSTGLISGTVNQSAGTSIVTVTATDGTASGSAMFQWTVSVDQVTVVNPGNRSNNIGDQVRLQIHASDLSGKPLGYSAAGLPPGLSIGGSTGLITGRLTTAGRYTVTVTARAADNATGSTTFTWTVANAVTYAGTIRLPQMPGNLALDDRHNSGSNGAIVQVWQRNGLPNQVWQVMSDGTIRHNGLCLDAVARGTRSGTKVQLWACNGGQNQQWDTRDYRVHYDNPAARNEVLDDTGYGGNGTQVQIWTNNGTRNQIWATR